MEIHNKLEAPTPRHVLDYLHLNHVVTGVRPVDIATLGVLALVVDPAVRIDTGDDCKGQPLRPRVAFQKAQYRLDPGRLVAVDPTSQPDQRLALIAPGHAVNGIPPDLTE